MCNNIDVLGYIYVYVCICDQGCMASEGYMCDLPRENWPSSHLVVFREIPFQNIKLIKATCKSSHIEPIPYHKDKEASS